ncbi:MAG: ATP-dependent RNA helicase HrpA [Thermodesulfobacteria bacterium]|nr:ATP-dependent RNA helicase HrpA [Thermodesulfobacteriota bacterium]
MTQGIRCNSGLPICSLWGELVEAVRNNPLILVTGETGSGKTTQLPKICLAAGRGSKGIIGCCQPRRIAAISVAQRVSEELGPAGKELVGYQVRFSHKVSPKTRIKFMTDGILLAEAQRDRLLRSYDTIILDEAHERSLNIDLIAGILKRLIRARRDLRVIVTSATMEVEKFKKFFGNPPLFEIPGRSYPVEIMYERESWYKDPKNTDLAEKVATACQMIRSNDPFGDILVFLPTEGHIFEASRLLKSRLNEGCHILPLFGRLAPHKQALIFKPTRGQKIILATNIAETSITVPGIRYVVDSGLARLSVYNVNTHTRGLPVVKIAKANAMQRAGRAGRVQKGLCIRLYSQEDFLSRDEFTPPEIYRCNLAEVILRILHMGLGPVERFPFIDAPKNAALKEGFHTLVELGAIDSKGKLTKMGKKMARMPLDPRLARIIFQAQREGCLQEILVIVSALSVQDIWSSHVDADPEAVSRGKSLTHHASDFFSFLKIWTKIHLLKKQGATKRQIRKFCADHLLSHQKILEWQDVFNQIRDMCRQMGILKAKTSGGQVPMWQDEEGLDALMEPVHRSILSGFLGHAACKKVEGAGYLGAKGKELFIFPGSCLFKKGPQWIVSAEQVRTSRLFARTVAPIEPSWIEELAPHLCKYSYFEPKWDANRGEAVIKERVTFYGMTIVVSRNKSLKSVDKELARKIFIEEGLASGRLKFQYEFNEHNKGLLEEIEETQKKRRLSSDVSDHEILIEFFDKALESIEADTGETICDEYTLRKVLRRRRGLEKRLKLTRKLLEEQLLSHGMEQLYPGELQIDGQSLPLFYRYNPGTFDDGIHVRVPLVLLTQIEEPRFQWLVPGFLPEKILFLLRGLPKAIRRQLEPLEETASSLARRMDFGRGDLRKAIVEQLARDYGLDIDASDLVGEDGLPSHLVMHFEVIERNGHIVSKGQDLERLKKELSSKAQEAAASWKRLQDACKRHCGPLSVKDLDSIPERVEIGPWAEVVIYGYVGICPCEQGVERRLFLSRARALKESGAGLWVLMESLLKKEVKHLKNSIHNLLTKHFEGLRRDFPFSAKAIDQETKTLKEKIYRAALAQQFPKWAHIPRAQEIEQEARRLRQGWYLFCSKWLESIGQCVKAYVAVRSIEERIRQRHKGLKLLQKIVESVATWKEAIMDACLMEGQSQEFLKQAPRYFRALEIRLERAIHQANKDIAKEERILPAFRLYKRLVSMPGHQGLKPQSETFFEFQIQLFEFMVSVFAPELALRGRSSQKRLQELVSYFEKGF